MVYPVCAHVSVCMYTQRLILNPTGDEIYTVFNPIKCQSLSSVRLSATLWTVLRQTPLSMGFPRQEYWGGQTFPSLQGIALTQGPNRTSCINRQILYHLNHKGSSKDALYQKHSCVYYCRNTLSPLKPACPWFQVVPVRWLLFLFYS